MTLITRLFLLISTLTMALVGAGLSLSPATFYAMSGVAFPDDLFLRSDLRSAGVLLLACAAWVAVRMWQAADLRVPLTLTALVYLGYGLGRGLSGLADGALPPAIMPVTVLEWVFGLMAVGLLRVHQNAANSGLHTARA